MKTPFATILVVFALVELSVEAQAPSEARLYDQLTTNGVQSILALDRVLKTPDEFSAAILYTASCTAYGENRLEDSGFLLYVARFRARFDEALFPPTGSGGNSPMLALAALQQTLGASVNPAIMGQPRIYARVVGRVKVWKPKVPPGYHPGWEYSRKGSEKKAEEATLVNRKEAIEHMAALSQLLTDPSYFSAFKTIQDHNLKKAGEPKRPSDQAYDAAVSAIRRIEKQKGISGVGPFLESSNK